MSASQLTSTQLTAENLSVAQRVPAPAPRGSAPLPGRRAAGPRARAAVVLLAAGAAVAMLMVPARMTVPAGGAMALALFIPVLCALSVMMKDNRSQEKWDAAFNADHFKDTQYFQIYKRMPQRSIVVETAFPILVIALINFYFTRLLVYTPDTTALVFGNFLLLGHLFANEPSADAYLRQSLEVMCFAYLGWYVWSISTIFSRLITMELVRATYYNVLVRLMVAVFVALVINHVQTLFFVGQGPFLAEAVGFGVGLFPDSALVALSGVLRKLLRATDNRVEDFPLDLIQGISPFRKLRLFEMGLDNCENLASANAVELFVKSNLKLVEVVDWIGQAQLLVLVGSANFVDLQKNGYRTVIDLHRGAGSAACTVLAGLLKFQPPQLVDIAQGLEQDPSYCNLIELRGHLREKLSPDAAPQQDLPKQG